MLLLEDTWSDLFEFLLAVQVYKLFHRLLYFGLVCLLEQHFNTHFIIFLAGVRMIGCEHKIFVTLNDCSVCEARDFDLNFATNLGDFGFLVNDTTRHFVTLNMSAILYDAFLFVIMLFIAECLSQLYIQVAVYYLKLLSRLLRLLALLFISGCRSLCWFNCGLSLCELSGDEPLFHYISFWRHF